MISGLSSGLTNAFVNERQELREIITSTKIQRFPHILSTMVRSSRVRQKAENLARSAVFYTYVSRVSAHRYTRRRAITRLCAWPDARCYILIYFWSLKNSTIARRMESEVTDRGVIITVVKCFFKTLPYRMIKNVSAEIFGPS